MANGVYGVLYYQGGRHTTTAAAAAAAELLAVTSLIHLYTRSSWGCVQVHVSGKKRAAVETDIGVDYCFSLGCLGQLAESVVSH